MKKHVMFIFIFLISLAFIAIISIKIKKAFDVPNAKNEENFKYNISQKVEKNDSYDVNVYFPITEFENLNSEIEFILNEYIQDFKEQIIHLSTDKKYFLDVTFEVYQTKKYISFLFNIKQNFGCLHDENYILTINYNVDKGKIIGLKDLIMKNENLLNDIARISYNSLISREEIKSDENMEFITYGTTPLIKNYEAFIINKNTLDIYFQEYQVVPYYLGIQKVEIPYEDINLDI